VLRNGDPAFDTDGSHRRGADASFAETARAIKALPKIDLHRHLAGSITAEIVQDVSDRYSEARLTDAEKSELARLLYFKRRPRDPQDYFAPWPILRKLFTSLRAVRRLVRSVVRDAACDGIAYMELRLGARSLVSEFSSAYPYGFEDYMHTIADAIATASDVHKFPTRCVLGISSRTFADISHSARDKTFERILAAIEAQRKWFVGVDLTGLIDPIHGTAFENFFKEAHRKKLGITIHAGEGTFGSSRSVRYAVETLCASRIGHGVAAAHRRETLALLAKHHCTLEICPTSNVILGVVDSASQLPLRVFDQSKVPYVICTDNPARCRTTLSEELTEIAKPPFEKSIDDIAEMMVTAVKASFADNPTKQRVLERLVASRADVL
jgi:adenosine deaminase